MNLRHTSPLFAIGLGLALMLPGACNAVTAAAGALADRTGLVAETGMATQIYLNDDNPEETRLGALEWRGGLKLKSGDSRFGGLSGLLVSDNGGRFLAVSDQGNWVSGTLNTSKGRLVGAGGYSIEPMLGPDGKPIEGKALADAESLIGDMNGVVYVSFERNHRIWRYDLSEGYDARPEKLPAPEGFQSIMSNGGLEGIALLKDRTGTLLALTEATKDGNGNFIGWLIDRKGVSQALGLKPIGAFNLTDLATLPNGDVLTLERSFSIAAGPAFQIRRIDGATIQPGAVLDGPVIAEARLPYSVDNMEGLDYRVEDDGTVVLYLISDDNFNPLQRTILLSFAMKP